MINRRTVIHHGCLAWACFIALAALITAPAVNADALWIVAALELTALVAATGAAHQLRRCRDRSAGFLICVSLCAPTYMTYVIGLPTLLVGLTLLIRPHTLLPRSRTLSPAAKAPPARP